MSLTTAFFDQIVGTAILVFVIFALTNPRNRGRWPTSSRS